jgi:hypothetical protein
MATTSKKLNTHVTFNHPDGGRSETFGPGDDLPDWVDVSTIDKSLLAGGEEADLEGVAPGPGQTLNDLSDEEKAEARREADRVRKANARASAKKQADDEAALKAAQEAEAKRAAEAAQGGGS